MKRHFVYFAILNLLLIGCINNETVDGQQKLLASDYHIFQRTTAWDLAKAVHDDDADKIKQVVRKNKGLVSVVDPTYGQTLLGLAVYNLKFNSAKTLVELGANPNASNNYDGRTPLMEGANIGYNGTDADSRFLILLLKHGGNPNTEQKFIHENTGAGSTPLSISCMQGNLEYVKILINAGADINYKKDPNEATLMSMATLSKNPDLVLYLLQIGVDFKQPTMIIYGGHKAYITDDLREWRFDIGSEKYRKKMEIVKFLKQHGMDYRKTKIPPYFYEQYDKDFLDKY